MLGFGADENAIKKKILKKKKKFPESFTAVYACGAPGMLKYVDETFRSHPRAYISMESRMACGMGACYACVLLVADEDQSVNKCVCEDGPVFETGTVLV